MLLSFIDLLWHGWGFEGVIFLLISPPTRSYFKSHASIAWAVGVAGNFMSWLGETMVPEDLLDLTFFSFLISVQIQHDITL